MQPALTEASTLSQFKKTNKQTTKNRLKTWRNEFCERDNARWHPRRGFVLKEMFLATHRLLALRTQANFSHLFPSPLSTAVESVCCKNTSCWLAQRVRPSPPFPGVLCVQVQKGCRSQVPKPSRVTRSPNTAECRQSRLPHTHGVEMALCRGHLIREELAGSRGIFGEELSCIAQWKRARKPWKRRDVGCCVPRVKLGLMSFNNRLHTLRSCGAFFCIADETLNHFSQKD